MKAPLLWGAFFVFVILIIQDEQQRTYRSCHFEIELFAGFSLHYYSGIMFFLFSNRISESFFYPTIDIVVNHHLDGWIIVEVDCVYLRARRKLFIKQTIL